MSHLFLDPTVFDILSRVRGVDEPAVKAAFTPSPAVAQGVMAQAQGGGAPPGGDPAAGGGMPPGAPPGAGGPPPGADPAAAMSGGPPGGDPSGGGAGPVQDAVAQKLDTLTQLIQQQMGGGAGGVGPNGKPNTASLKFEPQHFHALVHDIGNIKSVVTQMADAMGLQVPASKLMQQSSPGTPADAPGGPASPDAQAGAPGGAGAAGPPPSQIAQQLPALPPVAQKSAGVNVAALMGGFAVPSQSTDRSPTAALAGLAARFRKGPAR